MMKQLNSPRNFGRLVAPLLICLLAMGSSLHLKAGGGFVPVGDYIPQSTNLHGSLHPFSVLYIPRDIDNDLDLNDANVTWQGHDGANTNPDGSPSQSDDRWNPTALEAAHPGYHVVYDILGRPRLFPNSTLNAADDTGQDIESIAIPASLKMPDAHHPQAHQLDHNPAIFLDQEMNLDEPETMPLHGTAVDFEEATIPLNPSLDGVASPATATGQAASSAASDKMALQEEAEWAVQTWPNPTTGRFQARWEGDGEVQYRLLSTQGQVIQSGKSTDNVLQFDLCGFAQGNYHLQLSRGGKTLHAPIVLQR